MKELLAVIDIHVDLEKLQIDENRALEMVNDLIWEINNSYPDLWSTQVISHLVATKKEEAKGYANPLS